MRDSVLAINPGSTSTKLAIFKGKNLIIEEKIKHSTEELDAFSGINDQLEFRLNQTIDFINKKYDIDSFSAVVGRGGLLRPIPKGTYLVTDFMLKDLKDGFAGDHASNLGGQIASIIAKQAGAKAYIVDPVVVDEFDEVARLSGMPEIQRKSILHALNIRATAIKVAEEECISLDDENMIVAHLGGGSSVCAMKKGRMIDATNGVEEGAFTPERAGDIPVLELIKLAYSGKYSHDELKKKLVGQGGLVAYLGTNDCSLAISMAKMGNNKAALVLDAMAYATAKQIGAMATVLCGNVKCIVLTGGVAYNEEIIKAIIKRIKFIAPVIVKPGEDEMGALNQGVLRVVHGQEEAKIYEDEILNREVH